jgi:L-lactate dehydrogenase complex protein LldG
MISGREEFISRVSSCLNRTKVPKKPTELVLPHQMQQNYMAGASSQALLDTFITNARAVGIHIHQCSEGDLPKTLVQIINEIGTPLVLANDPLLTGETAELLNREFEDCHVWDLGASREENMARSEKAKIGVAVAEMALAETGTSLLFSHLGNGRSITLLPENSLIIIRAESIQPRLTQAMDFLQKQETLPSSVNFISGPSATADIELIRVQGVHGPLELIYVIVE